MGTSTARQPELFRINWNSPFPGLQELPHSSCFSPYELQKVFTRVQSHKSLIDVMYWLELRQKEAQSWWDRGIIRKIDPF